MANHEDTKKAHVILEAVRLASSAEVSTLHQLIANEPETLQLELVLRILLTYLPESTEPDAYIELLRQLASETIYPPPQSSRRPFPPGKELSDTKARTQVRQLHLLPLAEEQDLQAGCTDVLSCFLIHRARRIDVETGFIPEIQELLEPFLDRDPYLREWTISNILPLRRLDYEYYPQLDDSYTLDTFEKLEGRPAIDSLLSRSAAVGSTETIRAARDIRGVVGPWIYGESRRKRRKTHHDRRRSSPTPPTPANQGGTVGTEESPSTWSDVNDWIVDLAKRDFLAAVETVDEWNGPDDVDYGGYSDNGARDNDTSQLLRRQYAQAALATLYTNTATSVSTFEKSYNLLRKVAKLCDLETPPPLDGPETSSIPHVSREILDQLSEVHLLHNALLRPDNPLTSPVQPSVSFAAFILKSGFLFSKLGNPKSCRVAAGLASFAGCEEQLHELRKTLQKVPVKTRDEDSWAVARIQILWLRDWQSQVPGIGSNDRENTLGVFGKMKLVDVEVEVFRALLRASCYNLAVHVYCMRDENPIPVDILEKTILSVAMSFYDGASNGNRTRGGVRKASEIIAAFQSHFPKSGSFNEANALLAATHSMSFYSLTLQHGVPFQAVNIRASKNPLSLIGKILEQNPRSYTKLDDLIEIGQNLVRARLGPGRSLGSFTEETEAVPRGQTLGQEMAESSRRIISMAIEAALAEGDFDTAYSYIINRLSPAVPTSPSSQTPAPTQDPDTSHSDDDDISWRAAYLAGRFANSKLSPSQPSIRRLEQRLELLSLSLLLAPSSHLAEIIQVWRNVEADFTALLAREAAEEDQWNSKADRRGNVITTVPGGFAPSVADVDQTANQSRPRRQSRVTAAAANEEAPMGLFDVARGAAQAFQKSAFPLRATAAAAVSPSKARPLSTASDDSGSETRAERVRKRDMVANAVTGGLASGIGWVIGAQPAAGSSG